MIDRLIIIGWDGATWDYIGPLLEQGRLTNLRELLDRGAQATLKSTIPPYTNVAWPSLVTGLHPARTGIFDGACRKPGSYDTVPTNLTSFRGSPIWNWLNRYGLQAGVVNVPMTYPATRLDGYMVTGFDSPLHGSRLVYPSSLLADWAAAGHPYRILEEEIELMDRQNPQQKRGNLGAFVDRWVQLTLEQGQFIQWLWQERATPLLFTVFTGTDSINHRTRDFELIAQVYEAADEALGTIMASVDSNTLVCLVSDHGSTPAYRYVALYRALADEGWLHFRPQVASRFWKRLPAPLGPLTFSLWNRLPSSVREALSWPLLRFDHRLAASYSNIDWTKTVVYTFSGMGALYLNQAEREPGGIVPEVDSQTLRTTVSNKLMGLRDQQDQELFSWVKSGQEIYPGAEPTDNVPDLVFQPARYTDHFITGYPTDPLVREITDSGEYGTHTSDGIFVLAGEGIRQNPDRFSAEIVDVVPTVLAALGLPIPENVDGRALLDLFEQPATPQFAPAELSGQAGDQVAMEDADELMERLRNLGYL